MMEDRDIERVARDLGVRAAGRLDVERVAAGVVARLRADRERAAAPARAWWTAPVAWRLAAALAILIAGGTAVRAVLHHTTVPTTAVAPVPVLRDLTDDELIEVFDSLGVEAPVHDGLAVGLENLNEAQLKELLSLMEG